MIASPIRFWRACFKALGCCVLAGIFLRAVANNSESQTLAEISNMVLFLPCSVAAVWAAWGLCPRTRLPYRDWGSLAALGLFLFVACIARFAIASYPWNFQSPGVQGYSWPVTFWLGTQLVHWLGCFVVAFGVAKIIQWVFGIAVFPYGPQPSQSEYHLPGSLSVAKLCWVVTLCACAAFAYQRWFLSLAPGIVPAETSPAWFELFPVGSRPWVAGLVGGILIPIHWLAVIFISDCSQMLNTNPDRFESPNLNRLLLRTSYLALWCLAAAVIQAISAKLYFSNLILPPTAWSEPIGQWSRLMEYSIGQPYIVPAFQALEDPPLGFYLFKAALQTCLVLVSVAWLRNLGYRIGFAVR